eukprot:CAMPEP_0197694558 /NCGR_PEP_ID=MMETSP1338-20131121/113996_1 /TAXON_ID=43686 ORGANISM="Pelagodinium beii, Strain RCC1491" /NCGR_SAMPLE_ID=MMETSP1338 /ASSEMBLY_ACC=CAM_ASM_000754 /LENGTH=40 /DNA_ID= /DNA_START= /DNA_END= /DNA_ORIENTATION=
MQAWKLSRKDPLRMLASLAGWHPESAPCRTREPYSKGSQK